MSLSHSQQPRVHLRKSGLVAKLWPNGQIVFYHPKKERREPVEVERESATDSLLDCIDRAYSGDERLAALRSVGLSNVANSDKSLKPSRSGLSGITSLGKTRVRNAAYMMKADVGKHRLTFSTVTIPSMSTEEIAKLHVHWHKLIERYRLEVGRVLRSQGLPGEIVGVTEIQEQRYETTGFPVLHAHFLFVGASRNGGWALTPRRHDFIWRKCILSVCPAQYGPQPRFDASCNLQSIKKDPAGYLSKYMSKGVEVTAKVVADGLEWWLPKQWWNCSISLVRRMNKQIRLFSEGALWLMDRANDKDREMFSYYREVPITLKNGDVVVLAGVGLLTPATNNKVRKFLDLSPP